MTLHVFRHVEAEQINAQAVGQLLGHLGFTNAGGAREQEGTNRFAGVAQARARHLDRTCERINGIVLPKNNGLQIAVQILERALVIVRDMRRRDAGDARHDFFDFMFADDFLLFALGQNTLRGTRFINHVNGFVREMAIRNVTCG